MQDTLRALVVGLLAMLAVAYAAVTLDSTVMEDGGSGGGSGEGEGGGPIIPPESEGTPGGVVDVPFSTEIWMLLLLIAGVIIIIYVVFYWREAVGLAIGTLALLGVMYILVQFVTLPELLPGPSEMDPANESGAGDEAGGNGETTTSPFSRVLILVLFGGALITLAAVVRSAVRDTEVPDDSPEPGQSTAASVGQAAGRAADRIEEEAEVDNEVYRAWREMTVLLDVDAPETSTPGEFADAAVAAGLRRKDVDELTRLFEDVRYGDRPPSVEDEQRALAVFRRIEAQYAEDKE